MPITFGYLSSGCGEQHESATDVLGDGSINIRDDDLVVPVPQIDGALAAARALVLCGDAERHIIGPFLQFEASLVTQEEQ